MVNRRSGVAKVIIIVILLVLVAASYFLMTQEQKARDASMAVHEELVASIEDGLTPEAVHDKVGRKPHESRKPGKNVFVEEYHWKGPMSQHTVYAYYKTAASQFLEAVSINQKLDEWEDDDK